MKFCHSGPLVEGGLFGLVTEKVISIAVVDYLSQRTIDIVVVVNEQTTRFLREGDHSFTRVDQLRRTLRNSLGDLLRRSAGCPVLRREAGERYAAWIDGID